MIPPFLLSLACCVWGEADHRHTPSVAAGQAAAPHGGLGVTGSGLGAVSAPRHLGALRGCPPPLPPQMSAEDIAESARANFVLFQIGDDKYRKWANASCYFRCMTHYAKMHPGVTHKFVSLATDSLRRGGYRHQLKVRAITEEYFKTPRGTWLFFADLDACIADRDRALGSLVAAAEAANAGRCSFIGQDAPHAINSGGFLVRRGGVAADHIMASYQRFADAVPAGKWHDQMFLHEALIDYTVSLLAAKPLGARAWSPPPSESRCYEGAAREPRLHRAHNSSSFAGFLDFETAAAGIGLGTGGRGRFAGEMCLLAGVSTTEQRQLVELAQAGRQPAPGRGLALRFNMHEWRWACCRAAAKALWPGKAPDYQPGDFMYHVNDRRFELPARNAGEKGRTVLKKALPDGMCPGGDDARDLYA